MAIRITANNQWRNLQYRSDVPAKVLADQFDHLSADDVCDGFFCYRGNWYHTSDFMRATGCPELNTWHGYTNDSMCSGVVLKLSSDGERYKVGTFCS